MTREAVSAAKPAVRAQAKTEKVHGAASAAALKGLVYGAAAPGSPAGVRRTARSRTAGR